MRPGKRLGGKPPRAKARGRLLPTSAQREAQSEASALLLVLAVGLFLMGLVAGYGWSLDLKIRGGILRQRAEAQGRPDWVRLERLPSYVPEAFIAVVDPSFPFAGALRTGEAGTTLARELVRQVHLLPPGLGGEARELVMGPVLEHRTSKRGLLELYLNRAYLGDENGYPVFGVFHAAQEFFDKRPEELTLGEAATLAGMLLEPRITRPGDKAGSLGPRRNEVLRVLLEEGRITPEQFRAAQAEPLGFQLGPERMPMTRPADYAAEPEVIRLPEELRPRPDSVPAE